MTCEPRVPGGDNQIPRVIRPSRRPQSRRHRTCRRTVGDGRHPQSATAGSRDYPHEFSGVRQRVMIAMALATRASLIADRRRRALTSPPRRRSSTCCDSAAEARPRSCSSPTTWRRRRTGRRVVVMYAGQVVEQAGLEELFDARSILHPRPAGVDSPAGGALRTARLQDPRLTHLSLLRPPADAASPAARNRSSAAPRPTVVDHPRTRSLLERAVEVNVR